MSWFRQETEEERIARKAEIALAKARKREERAARRMQEQLRREARAAEAVATQNARDAK